LCFELPIFSKSTNSLIHLTAVVNKIVVLAKHIPENANTMNTNSTLLFFNIFHKRQKKKITFQRKTVNFLIIQFSLKSIKQQKIKIFAGNV